MSISERLVLKYFISIIALIKRICQTSSDNYLRTNSGTETVSVINKEGS